MKKILFILTLALLIPFSGVAQKYEGIQSLKANINETEELDEDRNVWLTWAKDPVAYIHAWSADEWGPFSRFEPADLAEYVGQYITRIRYRPSSTTNPEFGPTQFWANPEIRVYTGGSVSGVAGDLEFDYGTLKVSQRVSSYNLNSNNSVELTNPVLITGTEEIWFGVVYSYISGLPATNVDYTVPNASYQPNKSDLVYFGGDYDEFFSVTEIDRQNYCWVQAALVVNMCNGPSNLQVNYNENCHAVLTWDAPSDNPGAVYTIKRDNIVLVNDHPSTTYTDLNNDPVKPYTWTVIAKCTTTGESFPATKQMPECVSCPAPNNLTFSHIEGCAAVQIVWTASPDVNAFDIKRNGALIATNLTEKTYKDYGFNPNATNNYIVIAKCALGNSETPGSIGPCVGINETSAIGFSIVPNPAKDNIRITADTNFNKVEVINFLGQTVITQNNDSKKADVNVSNLTNGVYFVRIISDNGTSVQKFVKQ